MISRQDILDRAAEWDLRPDVVEKDYVLGWMLASIALHPETSESWLFKGGTCLKKCYFETYRFSEDLDFSLLPGARYTEHDVVGILRELAAECTELSGIEFNEQEILVRPRVDRLGRPTFEGRVGYRGPLAMPSWPRIRFDLTQHEPVLRDAQRRPIYHVYADSLPEDALVGTYSFEELIAEKTRALVERTRPRDLYDVVFVLDNSDAILDAELLRELFQDKCRVKSLEPPSLAQIVELVASSEELRADWQNMLAYQLRELPPLEGMVERLRDLLRWVEGVEVLPHRGLAVAPVREGTPITAGVLEFTGRGGALQQLGFAGANRLLVTFSYHGKTRTLEPYSLRRPATGNLLLHGWELESSQMKAFKVDEIRNLSITGTAFSPRYVVELAAGSPIFAPPPHRNPRPTRRSPSKGRSVGPRYVVQCSACGKRFYRKKRSTRLRKHKTRDGWDCSSRTGYIVDVRY
jgi:predicted nucleotidyltransferase component of viral defense system